MSRRKKPTSFSDVLRPVRCANCGAEIKTSEPRMPCTQCGSIERVTIVEIGAIAEAKAYLGGSARLGPKIGGKWSVQKFGDDFWRASAKWVQRIFRVDQKARTIEEHIYDPETGEVIRSYKHALEQHQGRGSAKQRNK